MVTTGRTYLAVLFLLLALTRAFAAGPTSAERTELRRAELQFQLTFYPKAETMAAEFCRKYTNSAPPPEFFLLQAKTRFELSNYVGAAEMLLSHLNAPEPKPDESPYYHRLTLWP